MSKITVDGNNATAKIAYAFSEIATIYPITPSSTMAEVCDEMSSRGVNNLFGKPVKVVEMQSEGGASGALHGSLSSGALTTTFTASQGLLLMIPNMYKIAGELLPCVMHVSARTIATHALSIFGDHSDVMAVRQTGWAMLCSSSVQECQDLALVAHLATLRSSVPFVHFFDGFRTSHELNTIEDIDLEKVKPYIPYDKIEKFKQRGLSSSNPHMQGTAQNPDIYFQNREACNMYYQNVPLNVKKAMQDVYEITGRKYGLMEYYGHPKANNIIILMGSGVSTAEETVDYLNNNGYKVGLIKVRLYRPFDIASLINALPKTVKKIAVLDRTKEAGAQGEPLYKDVVCALAEAGYGNIEVVGGRYGLGSKEFTPAMVKAVFDNLKQKSPKNHFTVGIKDDVTYRSLDIDNDLNIHGKETKNCKFYGYGGDGTVSANKNSIKIITDNTKMYGQAYFEYDSKKTGNATVCHLRFSDKPIKSSYLVQNMDFVAVHNQTYLTKYNVLKGLKNGGTLLINTEWNLEELTKLLPNDIKKEICDKKLNVFVIDAYSIAKNLGLGSKINLIMQSAFFKLLNLIPYEKAKEQMKLFAKKSYGKKGETVLNMNYSAIDSAEEHLHQLEIPATWGIEKHDCKTCSHPCKYFTEYINPIQKMEGNSLPVSKFSPDGHVPTNTTQYEKRGIAPMLPCWNSKNCIQCNMCAFVCPHAAIRPRLIDPNSITNKPDTLSPVDAIGEPYYKYVMQVSPEDCTGCGVCASVCPAKNKAITMVEASEIFKKEKQNYYYVNSLTPQKSKLFNEFTVKGSQYNLPYFEFSGACAGCGETPYIKVVSQLFGNRMIIANATGCSSIYGASSPTSPYVKDKDGNGVAWANSLFEDNAEFGYGIKLGLNYQQDTLKEKLNEFKTLKKTKVNKVIDEYLQETNKINQRELGKQIVEKLKEINSSDEKTNQLIKEITAMSNHFVTESMWIIGGDGWAYDIGYGGLDHILASGEDVNILVLDTEIYSNTGGQASKATPKGAVVKFANNGKRTNKKDLGLMATTYKDVYVAKVAMGANMNQFLTAVREAENYKGVSLIIAYAPCIDHGFNMSNSQLEMKRAVECGYWQLWRFNPELLKQGKSGYILDSPEPKLDFNEFLLGENRYKQLFKRDEALAKQLFEETKTKALSTYTELKKLAEN